MRCAYCGREGPSTREHIFPGFLYQLNPGIRFGFNRAAREFHNWKAAVRDVCETCNNESLSRLDSYAKAFYRVNECGRFFDQDSVVTIEYDYHLLLRWLLKISYNAARAYGDDASSHHRFIPYILRDKKRPGTRRVELCIEIVRDHLIEPSERRSMPAQMKTWRSLPPDMLRIGKAMMLGGGRAETLGRFFAMKAYFFYIVFLPKKADSTERRAVIDRFLETNDRITRLKPDKNRVRVSVSRRDALDVYLAQGLILEREWREYLASGGIVGDAAEEGEQVTD